MASKLQRRIDVSDANSTPPTAQRFSPLREVVDSSVVALDDDVPFLIKGDHRECSSATELAPGAKHGIEEKANVAADRTAERLFQLRDEVSRIAATIARLSTEPGASLGQIEERPVAHSLSVSADAVQTEIRARRLRARYFSEDLFADPAWDMLLELLHAEILQFRVSVSSLCGAAAVPPTTALRWLTALVRQGLFVRRADPHDGRRVFVELAPETSCAMRRYFNEARAAEVT